MPQTLAGDAGHQRHSEPGAGPASSSDLTASFPGQFLRNPLAHGAQKDVYKVLSETVYMSGKLEHKYPCAGKGKSVTLDSQESAACGCLEEEAALCVQVWTGCQESKCVIMQE